MTKTTPKTEAVKPKRYPFVKREIKRTVKTKTGEEKASVLSAIRAMLQISTAQNKRLAVMKKSRQEKGNHSLMRLRYGCLDGKGILLSKIKTDGNQIQIQYTRVFVNFLLKMKNRIVDILTCEKAVLSAAERMLQV